MPLQGPDRSLPLAVTVAAPDIFEAHLSEDPARQFFHSSSYTANPIAYAAARTNLAIWRDEPVLTRINQLSRRRLPIYGASPGSRTFGTSERSQPLSLKPVILTISREWA